jgi:hypothetical protein
MEGRRPACVWEVQKGMSWDGSQDALADADWEGQYWLSRGRECPPHSICSN